MKPEFHNDIFDKGLEQISNSANWGGGVLRLVVTVGHPASQTAASTLHPTGNLISDEIAMAGGDFTLADRTPDGREITVVAKSATAQVNIPAIDVGTATSGGVNTLTDTAKAWSVNAYTDKMIKITAGTGVGQIRRIASNTATVITTTTDWTTNPDATSDYEILEDLHVAIYDGGGTPRLLNVQDISNDQAIISGNPINLASFKLGFPDPVSV